MAGTRTTRGGLGALLAVMCAALALVIGAGSSLALALPELARDTGATQTELTWAVNVYALTFAALLLPLGIAADRHGRRGALVLGLGVFAVCSAASGLVTDPTALIVLRGLAGAGAAAVMPATLSVLVDAYPPERRASAIGVWAAVSGAGALLGLVLAGVLLEFAWWGSVQLAFGALSAAVALLCVAVVPPSRNPDLPLDPLGGTLALLGLGALVWGIIEGPERGWTDATTLAAVAAGAVCLAAFTVHELRTATPMLDVRLFRDRGLSAGSAAVFLQFFAAFGLFFLAPQWLQYVHGLTPLQAALWLAPMALGIGPAAQLAPVLLRGFGARAVAAFGLGQMAVGLALLARQADGASPLWQFAAALLVFGVGFGLALTPGTALIIDGLPADRRTLAAAVNDVTREVGGALGGAVAASVLLAGYRDDLRPVVAELPDRAAAVAESGVAQAFWVAGQQGPAAAAVADGARDAFGAGYASALLLGAAVLLAGALLCGLLAPRPAIGRHRRAAAVPSVTPRRHPVVSLAAVSPVVRGRRVPRTLEAGAIAVLVLGVAGGAAVATEVLSGSAGAPPVAVTGTDRDPGPRQPAPGTTAARTPVPAPPPPTTPAPEPAAVTPAAAPAPTRTPEPAPAPQPTAPPAATTAAPAGTTAPPADTTTPPEPTTTPTPTPPAPAPETTPPAPEPTTPAAETTTPPAETVTPPAPETTTPPAETTTPPAGTTTPPAETTTPPGETTTPPADTAAPPAETPPADGTTTGTPAAPAP